MTGEAQEALRLICERGELCYETAIQHFKVIEIPDNAFKVIRAFTELPAKGLADLDPPGRILPGCKLVFRKPATTVVI